MNAGFGIVVIAELEGRIEEPQMPRALGLSRLPVVMNVATEVTEFVKKVISTKAGVHVPNLRKGVLSGHERKRQD
jgi:hypothetical protein